MNTNHLGIGMKAPDFNAVTTFGPLKMSDFKGKWVILFSHPGDFTPVCTTEFIAFASAQPLFAEKNTQLIGLSIDSNPSHLAWVYAIYLTTGIQIPFPVIADRMGDIANLYGMFAPDVSTQETVRNVFFIDPNQIIRAILIYPNANGRSIPEILRLLSAMQTTDKDHMRRITISLPDDLEDAVETLKATEQFKSRTYSQIIRYLLELGVKSEKKRIV